VKTTINDVAKKAGVSKSTVSNVINNYDWVPEETKKKVLQVINELNYVPDKTARILAGKIRHQIAVVIDTSQDGYFEDNFFYKIICGVESALSSANFDISVCNKNQLFDESLFMNKFIFNRGVSGLIIPAHIITDTIKERLIKESFPFVVIGKTDDDSIVSVNISNSDGCIKAVNLLVERGYKSLAYIGGSSFDVIPEERINAFRVCCEKLNLKSIIIRECNNTINDGYIAFGNIFSSYDKPDGIICNDDYVSLGVYQAIKDNNLKIPNDIGVITFNKNPLVSYLTPPITAIDIDTFKLGVKAAVLLKELVETGGDKTVGKHEIIPELVVTNSVRNLE